VNLTAAIHMHARLRPQAPAIQTHERTIDFAQLDAALWQAATRYRAEGLQAGQVVVLDIADPVAHIVVALGLARIGVAHLASLPGDADSVVQPLKARVKAVRIIKEADVRGDEVFSLERKAPANDGALRAIAAEMAQHAARPWHFVSSSGTTGRPKLFSITHRMALERNVRHAQGVPILASDRHLPISSLAFHSPKRQVVGTLTVGGCVVFAEDLPAGKFLKFVRQARVTRISCGPVHLHRLCALEAGAQALPQLRVLEVLGSTVSENLRRDVRRNLTANLYVNYGSSETSAVTVAPPDVELADTVGSALPGVQLQIVDDADKTLPPGEIGRIRTRAAGTVEGYFDDDEATARAFRGGWFYPGDLGMLTAEGQLIFKGRADDMMLWDGINIYPAEIEAALLAHKAVVEAVVFPVPSDVHQHLPVAAVTLRKPVPEDRLRAFCRARVGARAPRRIYVVDALPRNANGKVLTRELIQKLKT
jgi:acyl-coenzyme A synthetase/AMP-(fatty) acid ligase